MNTKSLTRYLTLSAALIAWRDAHEPAANVSCVLTVSAYGGIEEVLACMALDAAKDGQSVS